MNSPIKAPPPSANKDGTLLGGLNGRKGSISQSQGVGSNPGANASTIRPGPRRRETSESFSVNNMTSPIGNIKNLKEDPQTSTPPPSLLRRRTDIKESSFGPSLSDRAKEGGRQDDAFESNSPFGSFKRTNTGPLSAGINDPPSPWSTAPQSAGFPPMGTFGNFSLGGNSGQPLTPGEKKYGVGSLRGESRFKGLMGKDSSEETASKLKERASMSSMEKLIETENERGASMWDNPRSVQPFGAESVSIAGVGARTGSAALGGDDPTPPIHHKSTAYEIDRQGTHEDIGFSAFGTSVDTPSFRDMMHRREYSMQQTPQTRQYSIQHNEPMSPTTTNPYQSPDGEKASSEEIDTDGSDHPGTHPRDFGMSNYPTRPFNANFDGTASDRSQTSSTGPLRNFPNLGSLGNLGTIGGWSAAPGTIGTPSRAHPGYAGGFGDSIFGSLGDMQSPIQTGPGLFGVSGSTHSNNVGTIGRGSRMGSLFPAAMQDQMRSGESVKAEHGLDDGRDSQQNTGRNPSGTNAPGFGVPTRETDSPSRSGRGMLDDLFGNLDGRNRGVQGMGSVFGTGENLSGVSNQVSAASSIPTSYSTASTILGTPSNSSTILPNQIGRGQDPDVSSGISSQIPATQQRQMVMPDRMRWIYRDPQGNTQGPWSGLEMHDWYKAGFFSPELQVKKLEDADYEPLAQLIRRIGNSREPFLVPQIGIPHGSASAQPNNNTAILGNLPAASPGIQSGSAQPPFASSFPSFGTTLTAEQQNALERRKQEEQYLMARQKEHLAQQQVMIKQMHLQNGPSNLYPQQLHHHSSAHSLQSQPSFGSITSPTGYQPSPAQGPIQPPGAVPGFFDPQIRNAGPSLGPIGHGPDSLNATRDGDFAAHLERLNMGRGPQVPYGGHLLPNPHQESLNHQQQVATMLQDRARHQREQEQSDTQQRNIMDENNGSLDRFMQFHQLRDHDNNQGQFPQGDLMEQFSQKPTAENQGVSDHDQDSTSKFPSTQSKPVTATAFSTEPMSLTEQVQQAAFAKHSPTNVPSAWTKSDTGLPQQFPPPPSISPLPAPAAQRNRQNVADNLTLDSRSRSQTPSVETPSATIAPWARENNESSKGPSIKEIQEAEALIAAQQEEITTAARRALAEQERQAHVQPAAQAPGLPSSANWASSASPAIPNSTNASAWAKLAGKPPAATPASGANKSLAQIQKEEETRKKRLAAAQAATAASNIATTSNIPGGKRYADLASKASAPPANGLGGAWTTVGAGGKLKTPSGTTNIATPASKPSAVSSTSNPVNATKPKLATVASRNSSTGMVINGQAAIVELQKWAKGALSKGLNSSIDGKCRSWYAFSE